MSRIAAMIDRTNAVRVRVMRATVTRDAEGAPVSTFASVATLNCSMQLRSGNEAVRYGRENNRAFGRAYFAGAPDVRPEDRLEMIGTTRVFRIEYVAKPVERTPPRSMAHTVVDIEETL